MLECEGISAAYGSMRILRDVSLEISESEFVALIGANSAGKSTLLKIISGLLRPLAGNVIFRGDNLVGLRPHEIVHHGIIQIPEGRWIFPEMTVQENLLMGGYSARAKPRREASLAKVYGLFPHLQQRKNQIAGSLSGGEQQMLAVGRGLMADPLFLMLDEPSLGLAPMVTDLIFEVLQRLNHEKMTIFLVEQNVQLSLEVAGRAYVLEHGRIVLQGPSKELQLNSAVKKAYLGI